VYFLGKDLLAMAPEERAREGLFLGFQHPAEIPGVPMKYFLRTCVNAIRKARGLPELDAFDFLNLLKEKASIVDFDEALLNRAVNTGFSGGEKSARKSCNCFYLSQNASFSMSQIPALMLTPCVLSPRASIACALLTALCS